MSNFRIESDLLGEKQVPLEAYYGIQTLRAIENFNISSQKLQNYRHFIQALAIVKKASAHTNHALGILDEAIFKAIDAACDDVISGQYDAHFPIDLFQGGAGTSTNMNINEVIANIALEKLGHNKGEYQFVSPNDHVNLSQSTNDAYPTALKLAVVRMHESVLEQLDVLKKALFSKAQEFSNVIKMGRTQLQDAVPMTLGQEFEGFAHLIERAQEDLSRSAQHLLEVNMGATAIGTGINAPEGFDTKCADYLSQMTGYSIKATHHMIALTSDTSAFVDYSSALKRCALKLIKICNDLRLLSSGPRTGFYEIQLPALQPGSSIMPGKVNPVIPELLNQICYKVIGNDLTITLASENAQLQLNVMEPVIGASLFESMEYLSKGVQTFVVECINGIVANVDINKEKVMSSIGIVTALNPFIGYKQSTVVAKKALSEHKTVKEVVLELNLMDEEEIDKHLDPYKMIHV